MRRMMTKKKIIELVEEFGGGRNQYVIEANVDLSQDPLNPSVSITSNNIFNDLKAHYIKFHNMPILTIKYTIGEDTYFSLVKTFRIGYLYGNIDEFVLYTDWIEISGIGGEDKQTIMLKVNIDSESQEGSAKIRFPQHLYEHTLTIKSRVDSMEPIHFSIQLKLIKKTDTLIDSVSKLVNSEFSDIESVIEKAINNGILTDGETERHPSNLRKDARTFDIKLEYQYYGTSGQLLSNYTPTFSDSNVTINDNVVQIM